MRRIRQWETAYDVIKAQSPGLPVLGYRDGGDFIIIRKNAPDGRTHRHRLAGSSREIYLYCRHRRSFAAIASRHAAFSKAQIKGFLAQMIRKKLMFAESGQYLSLAVRTSADPAKQLGRQG